MDEKEPYKIIKTIETDIGKIHMLPPQRTATEQDSTRLHSLIAKLLIEDYMENQKKTNLSTLIG